MNWVRLLMPLIRIILILAVVAFLFWKFGGKIKHWLGRQFGSTNLLGTTGEGGLYNDPDDSNEVVNTLAGGVDYSSRTARVEKNQPLINLAIFCYTKLQGATWGSYANQINRIANLSDADLKFLLGVFWSKYNRDLLAYLENEYAYDVAAALSNPFSNPYNPAIERIERFREKT